jgi:hypothetical protein
VDAAFSLARTGRFDTRDAPAGRFDARDALADRAVFVVAALLFAI